MCIRELFLGNPGHKVTANVMKAHQWMEHSDELRLKSHRFHAPQTPPVENPRAHDMDSFYFGAVFVTRSLTRFEQKAAIKTKSIRCSFPRAVHRRLHGGLVAEFLAVGMQAEYSTRLRTFASTLTMRIARTHFYQ
jgi:hypothetical protein